LIALLASAALATATGGKPHTIRVSVKSNGKEVNNTDSEYPSLSHDGRFVSFESGGKLTPHDSGADFDIFVHNRVTGKTSRVSVKSNGKEATGDSEQSSISADGRFVAFASDAAFVGSDTNGSADIYVHDRQTGKTVRASLKSNGDEVFADAFDTALSADGRWVAFDTDGAFVPGDVDGEQDVYVRDLKRRKTFLVSQRDNGTPSDGFNELPSISGDGRFIAFQSRDQQMTDDPDYGLAVDDDIFVRDMKRDRTVRASLKSNGDEADPSGNVDNSYPAISANGRKVAFVADIYGKYVPGDTNTANDVYVHDLKTGKTKLASVKSNGQVGTLDSGEVSPAMALSANGRKVAFESESPLVGKDKNDVRDVYLHDMRSGRTQRVSVKSNGKEVQTYPNQEPAISEDGRWVGFASMAKFTGGDAGIDFDSYVRGPLP
jgi:Tol biopolymer transport system component